MRSFLKALPLVAFSLAALACADDPASPPMDDVLGAGLDKPTDGDGYVGNGAPSGWHFNLNLLGMSKEKAMTGDWEAPHDNGHRIFIPYEGKVDIYLREGEYQVVDPNGTDQDGAKFQLPNPDDGSGDLAYSVWIRPVAGKGDISFMSCFDEYADGNGDPGGTWCYAGELVQNLTKSNRFKDVSRDLLQVCAYVLQSDGVTYEYELVPLFSDEGENYFWHVDNNQMRNTQLRFYPLSTTPIGGTCTQTGHPAH
jgi:hypothetical protein